MKILAAGGVVLALLQAGGTAGEGAAGSVPAHHIAGPLHATQALASDDTVNSVPRRVRGRYFFMYRDSALSQYALHYRDGANGRASAFLGPGTEGWADGTSLAMYEPSPNAALVAYGVTTPGTENLVIRVRDVRRGTDVADTLHSVTSRSIAWTTDNRGFFYSGYGLNAPASGPRVNRVYYHTMGTPQADDIIVFSRQDEPELRMDVATSFDGEFAVLTVRRPGDERSMVYAIDLAKRGSARVTAPPFRLVDDFFASFTYVRSDGSLFTFLTDHGAPNGRLVRIDIDDHKEANWVTVVRETPQRIVHAVGVYDMLVLNYRQGESSRLSLFGRSGRSFGDIDIEVPRGRVSALYSTPDLVEAFYSVVDESGVTQHFVYNVETRRGARFRLPDAAATAAPVRRG